MPEDVLGVFLAATALAMRGDRTTMTVDDRMILGTHSSVVTKPRRHTNYETKIDLR